MKVYIPKIILFSLTLFIVSCEDNLEIEPEQNLSPGIALGSEANINNVLIGAYDLAGQNEIFAGGYSLAAELLPNTGDLDWIGTFNAPGEFDAKRVVADNTFASDYWIFSYGVSNQVNLVIDNLDVIQDETARASLESQAKFLRAVAYFNLVRFFASPYEAGETNSQLGVPIITEGVADASQITFPSRNTVEEVYDFVINDLQDSNLPAATALLARVYLQQGDYPNARDAANAAINTSGTTLTSSYSAAFNNSENSTEDIFAWQITVQDGVNDYNTFWATQEFGGRRPDSDVNILNSFFDIFDDTDDVRSQFFYEGSNTISTLKWQNQFANVPFIRLAEMYLIRAETNFRENTSIGDTPLADINKLRLRAQAELFSALTLNDIIEERKRELAFESFTLHDIKRLKESITVKENSSDVIILYDSDRLILPIPQRELDANPELEPNP